MSIDSRHEDGARSPAPFVFMLAVQVGLWSALAVALALEGPPSLRELAPFLALAIAGEELSVQVARSRGSVLSFSGLAHVAAAVILGPPAAALVAAIGVIVVDGPRKESRRHVLINASMFGGSIWVAGTVFQVVGGSSHSLTLAALPALALLIATRYAATSLVFALGTALASGRSFALALKEILTAEASAAVGEGSLGILVAFAIATKSWILLPLLIPLLAALYSSKATLQRLRAETGDALDSVAEVVDERDSTTAEHTRRVAEYVQRFAAEIELPERETERLVQAARYHDLGKIAVDVSTLSKEGRLSEAELRTIYRHPRLSARLLAPFRFAQEMAAIVELHHERFDGRGYYTVPPDEIPIEAHVLIVADSFDAMTSARPYRPALTLAEAAEELRDKAGTQFHPLIAAAFANMVAGESAAEALGPRDLTALRAAFAPVRLFPAVPLRGLLGPRNVTLFLLVATLALVGVSAPAPVQWTVAALTGAAALWWSLLTLRYDRARARALDVLRTGGEAAEALAVAALPGWVAWLRLDEESGRFTAVQVSGKPGDAELAEACAWALRREGAVEARLSTGTSLALTEASSAGRLALGLHRKPPLLARSLIEELLGRLAAFPRDGARPAAALRVVADADRRAQDGDRPAAMLVDLRIFEQVRRAAGQLLAEKVVESAELRLHGLLRKDDHVLRLEDDHFGVLLVVPDREALEAICRRIEADLRWVETPRNTARLEASVKAAYLDELEQAPELAAIVAHFTPVGALAG